MEGVRSPPLEPLATLDLEDRRAALRYLEYACTLSTERTSDGPAEGPPVREAAALKRMAYCHNLEPLLHSHVASRRLTPPSRALEQRWETAYFENMARNNAHVDALAEMLRATEEMGVEILLLKGLATAARAYGDAALRPMSDLDLLCRPADLRLFCRAARSLGYRTRPDDSPHHVRLSRSAGRVLVELHFDLYGVIADRETFLSRAFTHRHWVEVEGLRIPTLSPPMELVLSLAHLVHHDFKANLRGYLDIARLIAANRSSPAMLEEELRRADLDPEWRLLLGILGDRFSSFSSRPPTETPRELLEVIDARLLEIDSCLVEPPLGELSMRGWSSRLAYARRLLFPPSERLDALSQLASTGDPRGSRWRHFTWVVRGALGRFDRASQSAENRRTFSVKRQLYGRR